MKPDKTTSRKFRIALAGLLALITGVAFTQNGQNKASANYPHDTIVKMLRETCRKRGIVITDFHIHIRGGMTPELAQAREEDSGIRSSAMENHGREWEVSDNATLRQFAARSRGVNGAMPVGIQVNDRDWFRQIDAETRAKFDYILADTMIMGTRADGKANPLWEDQNIPEPEAWMKKYMAHNLQILGEPITILANPTYLPKEIEHLYDELWTDERMRAVISKAIKNNIALEIQAESDFPRPKFLKMAKAMGAKFAFGTNNFDFKPKNLSRWFEVIEWLDLRRDDILSGEGCKK